MGKKWIFGVALTALLLAVTELCAFLGYRFVVPEERRRMVEQTLNARRQSGGGYRYRGHPYFNFLLNPEYSLDDGRRPNGPNGLRMSSSPAGEKPRDRITIVAVGSSTTYGYYFADERNTWPALLGEGLRSSLGADVEVVNAGVPYFTTYEMIGLVAMRVPEFEPDIVLLKVGMNDAFAAVYPDEGGPDGTAFRHPFSDRPLAGPLMMGMQGSYTVRLLAMALLSRDGYLPGDMAETIQYPVPPREEMTANAGRATGRYFRRNLETLVALAEHAGAVPVLVTIPLSPRFETGQDPYHTEVVRAAARNRGIVTEVAAARGLMLVDLYEGMREPDDFADAIHVNLKGMGRKADLVTSAVGPLVEELMEGKGGPKELSSTRPGPYSKETVSNPSASRSPMSAVRSLDDPSPTW